MFEKKPVENEWEKVFCGGRKRKRTWLGRTSAAVDVEEGTCSVCAELSSCSQQGWQMKGEEGEDGAQEVFARKFVGSWRVGRWVG